MPASPINDYLTTLRKDLRRGDTTERSHYPTLKVLVQALAPGASVTVEPKWSDWGAPDFHIKDRNGLIIGHIEAKNVSTSLDEAEHSEQLKERYLKAIDNLVLTNFLEFRWYVRGERRSVERLGTVESPRTVRTSAAGHDSVLGLLRDFLSHTPQGAQDAKDLAVRLARLAHEIRNVVLAAINQGHESPTVTDLRRAMEQNLVPDLTAEQFSDMFAQTLTYGFFAAWCNHPINRRFTRRDAASEIPKTNPFLRDLFELMTGNAMDVEPFAGYVDDLVQLLDRTDKAAILADFGTRTGRADPVVHFYETFLREYDRDLRKLRGIYYTPEPVVCYIVRSVDHLLRTRFNCPNGLADTAQVEYERELPTGKTEKARAPRVLILDPACGTGTFLYAVVDHIRDHLRRSRSAGSWSSYVRDQLLPRLFGFELLMAPYAVAHLKLGMQLAGQDLHDAERPRWAYDFAADERLGVYLTNTLEEPARRSETLFGPLRIITAEANAAVEIKRDLPIMVVIGNPPYSKSVFKGAWILALLQDYKQGLAEKKVDLDREEWKFLRFAQWRVQQSGSGIVGLVINNRFVDALTHRQLRRSLLHAFSEIYVLDLHGAPGDARRSPSGRREGNVFDIQKLGVTIVLLVRTPPQPAGDSAAVYYHDIWGSGEEKLAQLRNMDFGATPWLAVEPKAPDYLFVPRSSDEEHLRDEYHLGVPLRGVLSLCQDGVKTDRDALFIGYDHSVLADRMRLLFSGSELEASFVERYAVRNSTSYNLLSRLDLHTYAQDNLRLFLYRPFDLRWLYYARTVTSRPAYDVMRHMLNAANIALVATRQTKDAWAVLVTKHIAGHKSMAAREINSVLPLYSYPHDGQAAVSRDQTIEEAVAAAASRGGNDRAQQHIAGLIRRLFPDREYPRWPNLNPLFLADLEERLHLGFIPDGHGDLAETFGPEDVFEYVYAILHCPTYRSRYADLLKRDFPRIPFTPDKALFASLAGRGANLVALHLMESPLLAGVMPEFSEAGADIVERVHYNANEQRVYINKTQYFANVPSDVWSFHVGGYQVCEKWLKDRKGRKLEYDDQQHYQRITVALRETIRLMSEIDALIPGWPLS